MAYPLWETLLARPEIKYVDRIIEVPQVTNIDRVPPRNLIPIHIP